MNRLIDVVPASTIVYKESSPLTFTEGYRQFLLDVKIDQKYLKDVPKSPEAEAKIKQMEQVIQKDMDQFLELGDKCYAEYEAHLVSQKLTRIAYTFDKFAAKNAACKAADQQMINHETHSKELADYLASLNPYDELFRAIGNQTQHQPDWNFNKEAIVNFAKEHVEKEKAGQKLPTRFQVLVNMVKYYFNKDYFGNAVQMEESCVSAHLDFNALGWKDIPVTPHYWYNQATLDKYKDYPKNSRRNYFNNNGILQRQVTKLVVAYKPALKFVVTKAMKNSFIEQSTRRNFRAVELGPYLYNKAEFINKNGNGLLDTYEMVLSASTADPQVIGFKTKSYNPLPVAKISTNEMTFCQRQNACKVDKIPLVPIHRYYGNGHHFYTSNGKEVSSGWNYEGIQGYCQATQVAGTAPLYRYYNRGANRHFYTTNFNELGNGRDGWVKESIVCYVHTNAVAGTVPWYRRLHSKSNDRLYTTNKNEVDARTSAPKTKGFLGMFKKKKDYWKDEGIACYLLKASSVDKAIACCKCQ
jgi:phosphopantetheinyl transferase (holo-ACP synthase)